jgi:hypothetical protein
LAFSPDVYAYKIAEKLQENFNSAFILMVSCRFRFGSCSKFIVQIMMYSQELIQIVNVTYSYNDYLIPMILL